MVDVSGVFVLVLTAILLRLCRFVSSILPPRVVVSTIDGQSYRHTTPPFLDFGLDCTQSLVVDDADTANCSLVVVVVMTNGAAALTREEECGWTRRPVVPL